MNIIDTSDKDVKSLYLFKILYEERNLSKASQRMGLSQPAMSHRLNKMRDDFGDPLFVKSPTGLSVTPIAEQHAADIMKVIVEIEQLYRSIRTPHITEKRSKIRIFSNEIAETFLIPNLLSSMRKEAPNLQVAMFNTRGELPKKELENGTCDIAIAGYFEDIPDSFYIQKLCTFRFVVLAHRENPKIKNETLELNEFLMCDHIIVTLNGDLKGEVDNLLESTSKRRRVVSGFSSFLAPQAFLEIEKDILFVCLLPVAEYAVKNNKDLIFYECPIELPNKDIVQVWHSRTHHDPTHKWVRNEIKQSSIR